MLRELGTIWRVFLTERSAGRSGYRDRYQVKSGNLQAKISSNDEERFVHRPMSKNGKRLESTHCLELQSQILIWARTKEDHADGECLAFRASLRACIACGQSYRLSERSIWDRTHWKLAEECSIDLKQMSENTFNTLGTRWVSAQIALCQRVCENASALTCMRLF